MNPKSIGTFLSETTRQFAAHGLSYSRRQAEDLLCDLLGCSRQELYQRAESSLNEKERILGEEWVQRRLQGEPLPYLSGKVEFYGCLLEINRHVLIPRQETEVLVDKIVQDLKKEKLSHQVLWDLCSGSGCIGIALKKALPALSVYLSDLSSEAVQLAQRNAERNKVAVTCLRGDLLEPFRGKKAHYVVCNPPYISEEEYLHLDREVKEYEPRQALVGGREGVEFYKRLARELPAHLCPHGKVWLEIGYQQGEAVQKIFNGGNWKRNRLEKDWAGHSRFFFLENE